MDKLKFGLALGTLYFAFLPFAQAQSCESVINQARLALPATPPAQPASLWNLNWLQGHLGQADTGSVVETHYQWEKGVLLARDSSVVKTANFPDEVSASESVNDILKQMGTPKQVESTILVQYRWVCAGNSSYLEVLMDKDKLVYADGQTCSAAKAGAADNCDSFSGSIMPSHLESRISSAPAEMAVSSQQLKDYNDHFKTNVKTTQELSADMIARLKAYLGNLRTCQAGVYEYATPESSDSVTFVTSTIKGLQDNFCMVETTQHVPQGSVTTSPISKCQYQQQNLAIFADVEAENLINGIDNPQIDRMQETQCKVFLNGQEIPMVQ